MKNLCKKEQSALIFQEDWTYLGFGVLYFVGTHRKPSHKTMWKNKQLIPARKTSEKQSNERGLAILDNKDTEIQDDNTGIKSINRIVSPEIGPNTFSV